jgi:hypothetical protein
MDGIQNMGQRIVEAARLAVAVHFYESVAQITTPENGAALRAARQILRRRVETGGAGSCDAGPDVQTSPRLGDLVTDDERDGLMGCDDCGASTGDDSDADPTL